MPLRPRSWTRRVAASAMASTASTMAMTSMRTRYPRETLITPDCG
jgi:hypothetical protein